MTRWLGLAVVALMLAVPAATAADWSQEGYDAARTGDAPGAGPAWNDTAFRVRLPGTPVGGVTGVPPEPLVADGHAYVAVTPSSRAQELDGQGVARVDLSTAQEEMFVSTDVPPQSLAIADGRVFVVRDHGADAYDLRTGEKAWSQDYPSQVNQHLFDGCMAPAVLNGILFVPCTEFGGTQQTGPTSWAPFVWAVDAATGGDEREQLQLLDRSTETQESTVPSTDDAYARNVRFVAGVSVAGPYVFPFTLDISEADQSEGNDQAGVYAENERFRYTLWALGADQLQVRWTNSTEARGQSTARAWTPVASEGVGVENPNLPISPRVTGTSQVVYEKVLGEIRALNPAQQSEVWRESLGSKDTRTTQGGTHSAFTGEALYAASAQTLYRFDTDGPVRDWVFSLDPQSGEQFGWGSLVAADERVFGSTVDWGDYAALYAVDAATGEEVWRETFPPVEGWGNEAGRSFSLGEGVLVVVGRDGWVDAIGRTEASLGTPEVDVSTSYPAVGENVSASLSGTEPGVHGNATRHKAIWGDGNETDWQTDPALNHSYDRQGNHTARFVVANDANQTASTTHTFHVGQSPPEEPSFVAQQFQNHPDRTYGLLGLAVALGGGAIGVGRRYRKRSLLERELEALEQGFEESRDQPSECEAFLDNRKARARSLALDGKLDEEQVTVIENRAEELRSKLRTEALEDQFGFLPHSLVVKARQMVEDGQVTGLERDAFLRAVEEDEMLTSRQRTHVRERIEQWFARDKGGNAA